jgi:predicted glycosyltransferase
MSKPRLLFHVQHMLGIGHRVRAERIAAACVDAGFDVTLMEGGVPGQVPGGDQARGVTRVQLPPAKAADAAFSGVVDADTGAPIDEAWRARRAAATLETLAAARPDVVLIEGFPFARRAFRFELLPLVERARARGARTAVSIRDILVERADRRKNAEIAEIARCLFDRVLVHGDPGFAQLADSFSATPVVADRVCYTGIVSPSAPTAPADGAGDVVVSAGGGATGGALSRAAVAARGRSRLSDRRWRILVGPNLPDADRAALKDVPTGIVVEPARQDFTALLAVAAVSVSQAGYNTVADLAVTGCPAVLVPFAGPTGQETEQPTRARLMRAAGRAVTVSEATLTPDTLAAAVDRAAEMGRASGTLYRVGGGARTAAALRALLEAGS